MNRFFYIVLFCCAFIQVDAQNFNIHGKILDTENKPITGANIYIEELKEGTISGQNGEFYIQDIEDGTGPSYHPEPPWPRLKQQQ